MNRNERALNKLKSVVDHDVYLKLLVLLAGETVYFPSFGTHEDMEQRNENICSDYWEGKKISELVDMYGLSESQIRRIIKKR